jgi:hypothetical protein
MAAYRHRITPRRPGERGGHLLGQARKACLPAQERARAIADPVFVSRAAAARDGSLCPECGRRPVEVATTGSVAYAPLASSIDSPAIAATS